MSSPSSQGTGCCPVKICILKHKAGVQEEEKGRAGKMRETQKGRKKG